MTFEKVMAMMAEMLESKERIEERLSIASKKLEIALMEGNDEEIEKARINSMHTYEACLDETIKMHKQVKLLKGNYSIKK